MTNHPIIFSAAMVLALLAGRKTQTRRLAWRWPKSFGDSRPIVGTVETHGEPTLWQRVKPGDRLWVKERLYSHGHFGFPLSFGPQVRQGDRAQVWSYFADGVPNPTMSRPSIHCPREFSRLTLTVTATKIERLHAIREADCIAEGAEIIKLAGNPVDDGPMVRLKGHIYGTPRTWFRELWDQLHGAGTWDANPVVVALTFTVEQQNIDLLPKEITA